MDERLFFQNDYGEGAHPKVMEALLATNMEHTCGYGQDTYSLRAQALLREKCACKRAQVHFLMGGTSANLIALAAFMRPYEAVICAQSGHINTHETGAVEGSGHKVLIAASQEGKVTCDGVRAVCRAHTDEHMVRPRVLYISQPTETGTVYTLKELRALRGVCDENGLVLYADGARLCSALVSRGCDVTLADMAALCDAFTLGGTKNGLLFGEAMVITASELQRDFRYMIKNRGGMAAKGRVCGVMFLAALEGDACMDWARHANAMADIVREGMARGGIEPYQTNATNQVFAVLTREQDALLARDFAYERWAELSDGRVAVRFVTSWATTQADALRLSDALEALGHG